MIENYFLIKKLNAMGKCVVCGMPAAEGRALDDNCLNAWPKTREAMQRMHRQKFGEADASTQPIMQREVFAFKKLWDEDRLKADAQVKTWNLQPPNS
jgi:hypothetical protein